METKINNEYTYDYKCGNCDTWSVGKNSSFDMCGDGRERWFDNYYCENCNGDCSISDEDDWNKYDEGDIIYFD